jgi:O-antigen/teichoic acid export membrane protein
MSAQNSFLGLLRLAAILLLWISTHTSSLEAWCALYLLTGILGALYAFWKTSKTWDWPTCEISSMLKDAKEGTLFSASESARNIYNDIDKTMLGHLAGFGSAGIYGAAYRIIDVSLTPVRSILTAAFPEMFRRGAGGLRATYSYALTMIKRASLAGLVICFALLLGAPLVSMLIGSQYTDATYAIRLLAPIPLLRCVHLFLADALSGAGLQRVRLMIQASVALLNIGVNLIILPTWSWRGAAWTSVGCDAVLALVIWLTVLMLLRTEESRTEAIGG